MEVFVGTSGYSYKEWKGPFYPEKTAAGDMLAYYAKKLSAVEINNTFYRLPRESVLDQWADQVPPGFRFSIKASRKITHFKRLKNTEEETEYLLRTVGTLGQRLGGLLFQLPPNLKKDLPRLEEFLKLLPGTMPAAFEFRHESWFDDDVKERLRDKNCALCIADTDEGEPDLTPTADWGYLRLRRETYDDADLAEWAKRVTGQDWKRAFVFFKHEDAGAGPKMGMRFTELAAPEAGS